MVAFLDCATKLAEAKIFADFLRLTKPKINIAAVGGLGIHDLVEEMALEFREAACSTDIAGLDTRGVAVDSMMCWFFQQLAPDPETKKSIEAMYRIYSHPMILVPYDQCGMVISELLEGRAQVMSGRSPTYSANTDGHWGT